MKSIVLLSYNNHQKKFFQKLVNIIESRKGKYKAYLLTSDKVFIKSIFNNKKYNFLNTEEISDVINYSYLKFKVRYKLQDDSPISRLYRKILLFKCRLMEAYLYTFLKDNNVNLVIVWNGDALEAALPICLARKLGIKTIFMENGYFPGTVVMDTQGVNAKNSLPRNRDFYENLSIDEEKLKQLKGINPEYRKLRGENKLDDNVIQKETKLLPDKFIFLPFQVHTDTQVLINSPVIKDMEQLLKVAYQGVEEFNRKHGLDYRLVVKEHPSDHGRIDYSQLKEEYSEKGVIFLKKIPMKEVLKKAELVITLNSTVGIEALLYGKPVLTLGDAFYNIKGITYTLQDYEDLASAINCALKDEFNRELVDKFLYFLRYNYLVESSKNDTSRNDERVVEKIISVLEGKKYVWM